VIAILVSLVTVALPGAAAAAAAAGSSSCFDAEHVPTCHPENPSFTVETDADLDYAEAGCSYMDWNYLYPSTSGVAVAFDTSQHAAILAGILTDDMEWCQALRDVYHLCYWCAALQDVIMSPSSSSATSDFCLFQDCATPKTVHQPGDDEAVDVEATCQLLNTIFLEYHSWPATIKLCGRAESVLFQCPGLCDQLVAQSSAATAGATATMLEDGGIAGTAGGIPVKFGSATPRKRQRASVTINVTTENGNHSNSTTNATTTTTPVVVGQSSYLGADTVAKQKALVWLSRTASFMSFLGAIFILYDVGYKEQHSSSSYSGMGSKRYSALVFHQLLFAMACFDIVTAAACSFSMAPLPPSQVPTMCIVFMVRQERHKRVPHKVFSSNGVLHPYFTMLRWLFIMSW